MADYERTVLEHYSLTTAYPSAWPAEKDGSDASDDENDAIESSKPAGSAIAMANRRKSKYFALERVAGDRRSVVPGSQKSGDGIENMVSRDEPDPLGSTDSVVRVLRQLGLPVQEDTALRWSMILPSAYLADNSRQ